MKAPTNMTSNIELHTIQQQIQINGAYSPLHWLLEAGYLPYSDYEDWRYGRRNQLDGAFTISDAEVIGLLSEAQSHSQALQLRYQEQQFYSWSADSGSQVLTLSRLPDLASNLSGRWVRPEDIPQMDLFMDNGAVEIENDVIAAIAQRRWADAETRYHQLCEQAANNNRLSHLETLVIYGKYISTADDISSEEAHEELVALSEEIAPVAQELLRHQAKDYLAVAWQRLARYLPRDCFDAQRPNVHVSYALAQLPDWPKVIETIEQTPSFYQYAALVARLAEAYWHQQQELALLLWCYIASLPQGENILEQVAEPRFKHAWNTYWELDLPLALFPAWFLLHEPGMLHHIDNMPVAIQNDVVFDAVRQVLTSESQGHTDIEGRKALKVASPTLLAQYLMRHG